MSWEHPEYSFGNPNAQPPTPTQTPTSAAFPSPSLQTPRVTAHHTDRALDWTPVFAEEYSVFNATPGRLTQPTFSYVEPSTPVSNSIVSHQRRLTRPRELEVDLAAHVHHLSPQSHLPPVDPAHQLPSSPHPVSAHSDHVDERTIKSTPWRPTRQLDEAFSGQTATPPQSATKEARKLAPKFDLSAMQQDQEFYVSSSATQEQPGTLSVSGVPGDMFSYQMSGPATAPAFMSAKPFWDPDNTMGAMDLDFSSADAAMFNSSSQRVMESFDWERDSQLFDNTAFDQTMSQSAKRRQLIAKSPTSNMGPGTTGLSFDFGMTTMAEDPFAIAASTGAVDPGLLFSVPKPPPSNLENTGSSVSDLYARPRTSDRIWEPYQHQMRESRRDEEELRRSRLARLDASRFDRAAFSSPAKSSRPSLRRTASESRPRPNHNQRSAFVPSTGPRGSSGGFRTTSHGSRDFSTKSQNNAGLASIPELSNPGRRTSVAFSIDANGRARTEVLVNNEISVFSGSQQKVSREDSDSPQSLSSSDDDLIPLPPRNSLNFPGRPSSTSSRSEGSRNTFDGYTQTSSAAETPSEEDRASEAETEIVDDGSGDATNALRKVVESRRKGADMMSNSRSQRRLRDASDKRYSQNTPQYRQQYFNQSSTVSPTTVTDPDLTPSTDRGSNLSDSTRCVCNSREGDPFMIQCESCEKWLHAKCVGIQRHRLPQVYICAFCAQTPNMRGGRIREPVRGNANVGSSPLAHKSFQSWR